ILDVISFPLFLIFIGIMLWKGGIMAWDSWKFGQHSSTPFGPPLAPFKTVIPVAALLMLLQGITKFIPDLITASKRGKTE
ncbi:TRAP transporter small permease subunit, partial [Chloroflexota bacterium]